MKIEFRIISISLFCFLMQNCKDIRISESQTDRNLTLEDSVYVERELLAFKNILFSELYNRSKTITQNKKNISCNDSLNDLSYYFYSFYPGWMMEDRNREKLLEKWLKYERYIPIAQPPDHPEGSLDLARALDFYNSDDLTKFLDSLRILEYKRIKSDYIEKQSVKQQG